MSQKPTVRVTTDGRVRVQDGFMNVAAGLGVTGRDKSAGSSFVYMPMYHYELINTYRQSWLAQRLIDVIPDDATRNWRQWNAKTGDVTDIEKEEKRHRIKAKVNEAMRLARLTGGSALYLSVRGQEPSEPLDLDRVRKGDLLNVALFSRYSLDATGTVKDLEDPRFGEPAMFKLVGIDGNNGVEIHPSRLVLFNGPRVPLDVGSGWRWGDPLLQAIQQTILQTEAFPANVVSLLYEANVDILTIPRLMEMMNEPGGDERVVTYLKTVASIKGNNKMLVLDGGDPSDAVGDAGETKFDRKTISFGGIDGIWDRIMQVMAGAAGIPVTRLWGRSPGGLNATGESDLTNYYQEVAALQSNEIEEALEALDECIIRSAMGSKSDSIYFDWRSIYEESADTKVNRGKATAEIIKTLTETGLFPDETMQAIAKNAMVETGALPGMEAAIEEFGLEKDEDDEEALAAALASAVQPVKPPPPPRQPQGAQT